MPLCPRCGALGNMEDDVCAGCGGPATWARTIAGFPAPVDSPDQGPAAAPDAIRPQVVVEVGAESGATLVGHSPPGLPPSTPPGQAAQDAAAQVTLAGARRGGSAHRAFAVSIAVALALIAAALWVLFGTRPD